MKKINMIVTIVMLIIGGVIGYKAFNLAADNGWVGSKKAVAEVKNDEAVAKNDVEMMPDGSTSDEIVPTDEESEDIAPAKEESEETVGNEVVPEPVQEPVIEEKPTVVREKQTEKKAPVAKESSKPVDNNKVYDIAEQMPSYPDGNSAMQKYLADNIVYPESAERRGVEGIVVISFIVETDGSLTNFKVVRSPDPDLGREALRVCKTMKRWIPGRKNGKPVRVRCVTPIRFKLQ